MRTLFSFSTLGTLYVAIVAMPGNLQQLKRCNVNSDAVEGLPKALCRVEGILTAIKKGGKQSSHIPPRDHP